MQELQSIQDIFNQRIFKIPDYQRGYSWGKEQLKDFWEDVVNLPLGRFHYTGMLSLKKVDKDVYSGWTEENWLINERGYQPFHVVDGQQRLTTIVIFIRVIYELLKQLPENEGQDETEIYLGSYSLKELREKYLSISKPPEFIITSHKFGYEVDNPSFEYLRHKIFNEANSGSIEETLYTLNLSNAKSFFNENIEAYFKDYGLDGIDLIFKKVTQNLMFNLYEISDDFDVFVAFETMNNRGKKLSNLELLKNRLIYLNTLYEDSELPADERVTIRFDINEAWKEVYKQLGRNKKKKLDDDEFLMAHWIIYYKYSRQKGSDYIDFLLNDTFTPQNVFNKLEIRTSSLEDIEEQHDDYEPEETEENGQNEEEIVPKSELPPKHIQNYVSSLKTASVHWYNTFNPLNNQELTQEESLWIDRLNRMGMVYFRPLITASFMNDDVTSDDRVRLLREIERFVFVIFRMGRAYSTYRNSQFYRAARELYRGDTTIDKIISELKEKMSWSFYASEEGEKTYFDHGHFQKYLQKKFNNGGGFYNWNGLRYFMYEYEMDKVRQRGSQKIDWKPFVKGEKDKVSIEHIYPQTADKNCWKDTFSHVSDGQRALLTNSLGNLLPLSMSINSSLQNDCFRDKKNAKLKDGKKVREGYNNGSHSEIEVSAHTNWTPETIKDRGLKLISFMEKRWDIEFENEEKKLELLFLSNI